MINYYIAVKNICNSQFTVHSSHFFARHSNRMYCQNRNKRPISHLRTYLIFRPCIKLHNCAILTDASPTCLSEGFYISVRNQSVFNFFTFIMAE